MCRLAHLVKEGQFELLQSVYGFRSLWSLLRLRSDSKNRQ